MRRLGRMDWWRELPVCCLPSSDRHRLKTTNGNCSSARSSRRRGCYPGFCWYGKEARCSSSCQRLPIIDVNVVPLIQHTIYYSFESSSLWLSALWLPADVRSLKTKTNSYGLPCYDVLCFEKPKASVVCLFCQNLASHVPWRVNDMYKQHTIVVILQSSCDRFSAYLGIIIGDVEGIMLLVGQTRASIFLDVRNLCPPFSSVLRWTNGDMMFP